MVDKNLVVSELRNDANKIIPDLIRVGSDGFVKYIEKMGNQSSIVQAARVSYGAGTKSFSDDVKLIRYLMRNRHTTPFEMVEIKFLVRVPMDIWRQWVRHRTASVNEYSTRYSEAIDSAATTNPGAWRKQSSKNRQGSGESIGESVAEILSSRESDLLRFSREIYEERLSVGVSREQARKDLPLSTYTEAYWKIDLHNLLHFLSLRLDSHAQLEIQEYARAISVFVSHLFPDVWEAFKNYRLEAISFSSIEARSFREGLLRFMKEKDLDFDLLADMINSSSNNFGLSGRESDEFVEKIDRMFR